MGSESSKIYDWVLPGCHPWILHPPSIIASIAHLRPEPICHLTKKKPAALTLPDHDWSIFEHPKPKKKRDSIWDKFNQKVQVIIGSKVLLGRIGEAAWSCYLHDEMNWNYIGDRKVWTYIAVFLLWFWHSQNTSPIKIAKKWETIKMNDEIPQNFKHNVSNTHTHTKEPSFLPWMLQEMEHAIFSNLKKNERTIMAAHSHKGWAYFILFSHSTITSMMHFLYSYLPTTTLYSLFHQESLWF